MNMASLTGILGRDLPVRRALRIDQLVGILKNVIEAGSAIETLTFNSPMGPKE